MARLARRSVVVRGVWLAVAAAVIVGGVSCSAASGVEDDPEGTGATGGSAGTAGSGAVSGGGGSGGSGGSGGVIIPVDSGTDAPTDATVTDGPGVVNDARPDVIFSDACTSEPYRPGPLERRCAAPTSNECDARSDVNAARSNGVTGNGFDDDCDGLVDEGCSCDVSPGETKPCWLVSGSQVDASGQAVGWCRSNSVGTMRCIAQGEFPVWDGECRGAQPPFGSDVCAVGDFDCDGVDLNSKEHDCSCDETEVVCPTSPITTAPFPPPRNLPFVDGSSWIRGGNAAATDWQWTATGGDCDNVLPHPSFQLFNGPDGTGAPNTLQQTGLGPSRDQTGIVMPTAKGATSRIHFGFGLSGDYLLKGEFTLRGRRYECTQKVQVRAPGIRAELCWSPMPNDVDLHFGRLQRPDACPSGKSGWFWSCMGNDQNADHSQGTDCFYAVNSGSWGYATSPPAVCHGWGSRRQATDACNNPRLDFDNIECNRTIFNPGKPVTIFDPLGFCGAENINLDNPRNGDRFAVAAHAYSISGTVKPHVNIYCNGQRKLSLGFQPGKVDFPHLTQGGASTGGDLWVAAVVEAQVNGAGAMTDCAITPVNSVTPKPGKDGSTDYCVDTNPRNQSSAGTVDGWHFTSSGGMPTTAGQLCFH